MNNDNDSACPIIMANGRLFTDYRSSAEREQYIKSLNGINKSEVYRRFLTENGKTIMDKEWGFAKMTVGGCPKVPCFFQKTHSRVTPDYQSNVLNAYNKYYMENDKKVAPECLPYEDYRASS